MSIETGMPEVPRYAMYSGCVLDQITWQMQRSGLLTATARVVAQGETVGRTTSAGTPAALELKRFGHFNGAITRNGSALGNVVSAEIPMPTTSTGSKPSGTTAASTARTCRSRRSPAGSRCASPTRRW